MALGFGLALGLSASRIHQTVDEDGVSQNYLFIDGEFFRVFVEELKEAARPENGELEIELSKVGSRYDRVFFYDAYPEKKDGQTDDEFVSELETRKRYFAHISTTQNFSVRPALTRRGQRRQQKGVDVLLAIECLMHAIRNNIEQATIMTSDLDFFPLFEALLQTKTKSVLRYQIGKTAPELIQAADYAEPLTSADFFDWLAPDHDHFRSGHTVSGHMAKNAEKVASGTIAERSYKLLKCDDPKGYFSEIEGKIFYHLCRSRLYIEGVAEKHMRAKIEYVERPE